MPKYWVKNYFTHGRFSEVGQKQKTEKKERGGAKVGDNNGQATHGARKHAWRTQAAWAKILVKEYLVHIININCGNYMVCTLNNCAMVKRVSHIFLPHIFHVAAFIPKKVKPKKIKSFETFVLH